MAHLWPDRLAHASQYMFSYYSVFNSNIADWDVSKVTSFYVRALLITPLAGLIRTPRDGSPPRRICHLIIATHTAETCSLGSGDVLLQYEV